MTDEEQLAAMLDPMDIPGDWTPRQREAYDTTRARLRAHIQDRRTANETLAKVEPQIAAEDKWLADLTTWRAVLAGRLLERPKYARTSQELGLVNNLTLSLGCIDRSVRVLEDTGYVLATTILGDLMRESGYVQSAPEPNTNMLVGSLPWFGSLPEVQRRLRDLYARRDDALARLESLREPETVTS